MDERRPIMPGEMAWQPEYDDAPISLGEFRLWGAAVILSFLCLWGAIDLIWRLVEWLV